TNPSTSPNWTPWSSECSDREVFARACVSWFGTARRRLCKETREMNSKLVRALVVGVGLGLFSPAFALAADSPKTPAAAPKKETKKHKHHKGDNKDNKDK